MGFMSSIKAFFLYDGLSKEEYRSIAADMHEQNRKNLTKYSRLLAFLFTCLIVSTFFLESIAVNQLPYLVALVFSATSALLLSTVAKNNSKITLVINYVFCTVVLAFCTYIGTVTAKDQLATSFCVALAILPFVTYDITLRSLVFRLVMCGLFICVDTKVKDNVFVSRDIVNVFCYSLLGTILSALFQKTQAQAFYLKRNMNRAINQQTIKIENLSLQSITAMAAAIDAKDSYTNGHSKRVAKYSEMIAKAMGKTEEEQKNIHYIAMLHDVGKIGIPDEIINKPSRLTDEEYNIVKTHSELGYEILKQIEELPDIAIGARYHHERYDGKGYPTGLAGNDIPEIGRIIAVADAYDAMTSNRSYRKTMTQAEAAQEIRKGMGTQFDPAIAKYMLDIISEDKDFVLHG